MILVTVGTHEQPFDRLVRACEPLAALGERVVVQRGVSTVVPAGCQVVDQLEPAALLSAMESARIVICHAGPSTIFEAAALGHVPIVVPRDPRHGEHVDDHQLRFAARLGDRVHVLLDPRELQAAIDVHDERIATLRTLSHDAARTRAFAEAVGALAAGCAGQRPTSRRARDTLRALHRWVRPPP